MKTCSRCKVEKSHSEFGKSAKAKDGLQWHCRTCKSELHKANHSARMVSIKASQDRRVKAGREYVAEYLGEHPCVDCGITDIRVLEFDHVRDKINGVAQLVRQGYSLAAIKTEIEKCEVRCRNCHTIKTYERIGGSWHDNFILPL